MKNYLKKIIIPFFSACLAGILFVTPVFAEGGAYVSDTNISVAEGETVYIAVGVDNATGAYVVETSGNVSSGGSGWLDNETATIGIYGASAGEGAVTIRFDTLATYDEEDLDGTTLTVYVNVYAAEDGNAGADKGGEDGQQNQEETAAAEEPKDKRKIEINGEAYTVLDDLSGIELPKGFLQADGSFNGVPVKVLKYLNELTLYALRKESDSSVSFMTYEESNKQFQAPRVLVQDQKTYYLLDVPEIFRVPEGYVIKDVKIKGQDVKGIVSKDKKSEGTYYIRAMEDGMDDYYSYDAETESLSDASEFKQLLNADVQSKDMSGKAKEGPSKALILIIGVLALIVIGLTVFLILFRKRENRRIRSEAEEPDDTWEELILDEETDPDFSEEAGRYPPHDEWTDPREPGKH